MQVHDRPHFRLVLLCAVQIVIDRKKVLHGQLIHPFHQQSLTAPRLKQRPRRRIIEPPHPSRRKIAMHLHSHLAHCHAIVRQGLLRILWIRPLPDLLQYRWNRQRVDIRRQRAWIKRRRRRDESLRDPGSLYRKPCTEKIHSLQKTSSCNQSLSRTTNDNFRMFQSHEKGAQISAGSPHPRPLRRETYWAFWFWLGNPCSPVDSFRYRGTKFGDL